ncbi:hypothetical protein [Okeania sp. SIO2B3]|uniref:hypothetical protein n=1 Tax=Okeania sp. SIO2B3 TaxID=2607784 RepID=UPI0013C0D39E|nr:hypothetical protein [Okeania sp. SIO2B3]NET44720.1 hypothetical protein [Okeania sp. SIO2B3]
MDFLTLRDCDRMGIPLKDYHPNRECADPPLAPPPPRRGMWGATPPESSRGMWGDSESGGKFPPFLLQTAYCKPPETKPAQ